jgi:DNA (cytosine-5)-methyltransferase 1
LINYYNENDPKAAAWLRELIKDGHIANGIVDERSIEDVKPDELKGYTQCHFFAGIGGWSYALRLAGWPDDREVWTGSCPCQPFSAAGKGAGFADERHLWPAFFHLIRTVRPQQIFGEQVANCLPWLDLVQADLEAEGYASGAVIMGAHSVGAPHIRQRLYWVGARRYEPTNSGEFGGVADSDLYTSRRDTGTISSAQSEIVWRSESESDGLGISSRILSERDLGHAHGKGPQGRSERWDSADKRSSWQAELVGCRDGKQRPVEPGTFPLAHGVPHRVGLLRGYGNAIVPQVAAEFVRATMDSGHGC